MKSLNRILRFIYAFFWINLIYNSNKFQCFLKSYELNNFIIIIILSVATFVILFLIDAIIDFFTTKLLICTDKVYSEGIKKSDAFKTMKYLKCSDLVLDIYFLLSPNLYHKYLKPSDKAKFFRISKTDNRLIFKFIKKLFINYIFITSAIYVFYNRTNYLNDFINSVNKLDLSNYKSILKVIINPVILGAVLSIFGTFKYSLRKNKNKEIIRKDDELIEEEVLLKIKELCKYFKLDLNNILNNIKVLIEHKNTFMSSETAIVYQNGSSYSSLNLLMNINNADKLKSLIKYFLTNENCIYYFEYYKAERDFLLLYRKLNHYLKDKQSELVLDILFNTENYINNFLKKDIKGKEYMYIDHLYYALSVLRVLIYFSEDFRKYTKSDIINKEMLQNFGKILEKFNDIQKTINKK